MTNVLLGDQTRVWCQTGNNLPSGWSPQASLQQIKKIKIVHLMLSTGLLVLDRRVCAGLTAVRLTAGVLLYKHQHNIFTMLLFHD